jgi:hypothetical protein
MAARRSLTKPMHVNCTHTYASGKTTYDREARRLIHVKACDDCGLELQGFEGQEYTPNFITEPEINRAA